MMSAVHGMILPIVKRNAGRMSLWAVFAPMSEILQRIIGLALKKAEIERRASAVEKALVERAIKSLLVSKEPPPP
jgi:hypothetical protein